MDKKFKLFFVGDAACVSGFARVTHAILDRLAPSWDIHVLGINATGDPHPYAYPIYPAGLFGDSYGLNRYRMLVDAIQPDVTVLFHDPWIVQRFLALKRQERVVAYLPIDAANQLAAPTLNALDLAITYTWYGLQKLCASGFTGASAIVPHGIDLAAFAPMSQWGARNALGMRQGIFVFGQVNRNQPRKRVDLLLFAFAEFLRQWTPGSGPDPYLLLHMNPTEPGGYDLCQLGQALGIASRVVIPALSQGQNGTSALTLAPVSDAQLRTIYGACDVQINTAVGEGWSLPTMEGMACGIPQILPANGALQEWAANAAMFVPCPTPWTTPGLVNTIGSVIDVPQLTCAMQEMYACPDLRAQLRQQGLARVAEPRFAWDAVAGEFDGLLRGVLSGEDAQESQAVGEEAHGHA